MVPDWQAAMSWIAQNTSYNAVFIHWWDYGYWITRIARRWPNTNPGQSPLPIIDTANFFLSQYEGSALGLVQKLDTAYIIIDYTMTTTKLWLLPSGRRDQSQFYDIYYMPKENKLEPVFPFLPHVLPLFSSQVV
jgi:asparagine N-glycosylation enzyme membrane subunit Stt3